MPLVQHFLEDNLNRRPRKTAVVDHRRSCTYAQLDAMANRLANALIDRGLRRGDRLVMLLPNCIEQAVAIFATLKAGAVFVVVNHTTKRDKLTHILNNCGAAALLTSVRHAQHMPHLFQHVETLKLAVLVGDDSRQKAEEHARSIAFEAVQEDYPHKRPDCIAIDRDLACLIYTSGSSGFPKGVMETHAQVNFAASSIIGILDNTPDDVVICALPLSFNYGLYQLLMTCKFGGKLLLEKSFVYMDHFLKRMEEHAATGFPGVPTMFSVLFEANTGIYNLSSLRYITNTAAALSPAHIRGLQERFPTATIFSMYGLTETKRALCLPPPQLEIRPTSVGLALPGTEVWLVDEKDRRLGPNATGELVIRGGHVMQGYWNDEQSTAASFRPGPLAGERVFYSGDLFRMDEEGYYYFLGRKDDIIKSRGEKVSPKEVENVLYDLGGVVEAAVVGVPDAVLGQAVKAVIVCSDPQLSEKHVIRHCRANLEDFMVPKHVVFVDSLPKTDTGKIKKTDIS